MNQLDLSYNKLINDILINGRTKSDRTGTGTISVFGRQIRHQMNEGFPILTTRKIHFKSIVTELLWFLKGDTNIKYLVDNDCNIWNGDCYKHYKNKVQSNELVLSKSNFIKKIKEDTDFAEQWGDLGPIYGSQWRSWQGIKEIPTNITIHGKPTYIDNKVMIDQIADVINSIKTNPFSRRHIVSAWAPHELDNMVLPPCHLLFQFYVDEAKPTERFNFYSKNNNITYHDRMELEMNKSNVPKLRLSLKFNLRSSDVPLGLPFNISSYAILLELIAREVNMIPGELISDMGDTHIYMNQVDCLYEQLERDIKKLPEFSIDNSKWFENCDNLMEAIDNDVVKVEDFKLIGYNPGEAIKIPLSN